MKLNSILLIVLTVFLSSCTYYSVGRKSEELNKIRLGMSKPEVISTIGFPSRVSADKNSEYLIYNLVDHSSYVTTVVMLGLLPPMTRKTDYFIKIQKNKVVSYGKIGDFDSAKIPEAKITIKQN